LPSSVYKTDIRYDSCEKICQVCLLGRLHKSSEKKIEILIF
jgi:hypothetical protein